jgi:hypothetical protein
MKTLSDKHMTAYTCLLSLLLLVIPLTGNAQDSQNCEAVKASMASSGVRTEDSVRCVFASNRHTLNTVFNEERKSTPALEGDIEIKLMLTPAGKVDPSSAISKNTTSNQGFEQKILNAVKGLDFGTAKDSFQTAYTLHFYSD